MGFRAWAHVGMVVLACCSGACGDDDGTPVDGGAARDAGGAPMDAAGTDAAVDAGTEADAAGCVDVDRDGTCRGTDCDDENAAVHPGATESCGNAVDDDCSASVDDGCLAATRALFVDRDSIGGTCSDSGPGTMTAPWCTIDAANARLVAGDTVYLRAGTYADETIEPASSGASDTARITYAAYGDEVVTLTGSVYCIRLRDRAYVTVLGLHFRDCERNLYLERSSHVNVGGCEFDNPGGPTTWAGSRIFDGSQYNRIYGCTFSRYGNQSGSAGAWDDNGAVLDIGNDNVVDTSDHNLVEDCTFFHGGHHILGVYSNDNVVRRSTFHNENWYTCWRTALGGRCGNRNVILNTSFPDNNVRNVIEDNVIAFSGVPPDQDSSVGLSLRTQHNIVRRNVFYHNDSSGLGLSADGGNTNDASHNHVYANVFFHNGYPAADSWDPLKSGLMLARWVDDAAHNPMTGVAIQNNVFHQNQRFAVYYYYVDEAEQVVADNWEEAGDPGFVSISGTVDPFDFGVLDFHLRPDSPCVDHGGFLTRTTTAGDGATVLELEDVGYFTDGAGVVEGDLIQLEGQRETAMVTRVDRAARTLTVDRPLTWAAGTGVSLPYFGARPDQGAYESP